MDLYLHSNTQNTHSLTHSLTHTYVCILIHTHSCLPHAHTHTQDEELQTQTEIVERLTTQLHELEDNLQSSQKEGILLKKQITVIEQELLNSQEEVHEVMQALEELAVSYDSKDREIEAAQSEKKLFIEEMEKLQVFCHKD